MSRRLLSLIMILAATLATAGAPRAALAQYRGMAAGWPYQGAGYYAVAAPSYGYGLAQPYVVARPVVAAQYAPVTAYANPNFAGAYNVPANYYKPAPTTAYYAPTADQYAGSASYNYGPQMRVAYMAPAVAYRPSYQPVTVYAYRPVTVYDPVTAQPVTCLQPAAPATSCQPSCGRRWCSWLHPFRWCGSGGCGAAPTTAYCGSSCPTTTCGTAACAQPYYNTQPAIIAPAPTVSAPVNVIPVVPSPGTSPRIVPPPTRFNAVPNSLAPADVRPSLPPAGGSFGAPSGTIINPGTGVPSGSFGPSPTPSGGNFNPNSPGSFNSPTPGAFYPPATDPYLGGGAALGTPQPRTETPVGPVLSQPDLVRQPTLNSSVQPVPDPDARQPRTPINRAPQLLDPRDRSAKNNDVRWAVIPAIWPTKGTPNTERRSYEERSYSQPRLDPADFDDSGWKSSR